MNQPNINKNVQKQKEPQQKQPNKTQVPINQYQFEPSKPATRPNRPMTLMKTGTNGINLSEQIELCQELRDQMEEIVQKS